MWACLHHSANKNEPAGKPAGRCVLIHVFFFTGIQTALW